MLEAEQEPVLLRALNVWLDRAGDAGLPEGLLELRELVADDVAHEAL